MTLTQLKRTCELEQASCANPFVKHQLFRIQERLHRSCEGLHLEYRAAPPGFGDEACAAQASSSYLRMHACPQARMCACTHACVQLCISAGTQTRACMRSSRAGVGIRNRVCMCTIGAVLPRRRPRTHAGKVVQCARASANSMHNR